MITDLSSCDSLVIHSSPLYSTALLRVKTPNNHGQLHRKENVASTSSTLSGCVFVALLVVEQIGNEHAVNTEFEWYRF